MSQHNFAGVANELKLESNKELFHGTLATEFTHDRPGPNPGPIHYHHPPTPDEPAWFADNEKFALHAAVRFTQPGVRSEITLHSYSIYGRLHMMSLRTMADLEIFMREQFQVESDFNGLAEGLVLANWSNFPTGLEGYALLEDTVRGEPEYVLFRAGLEKLRHKEARKIHVVPVDGMQSILVADGTNTVMATYTYDGGPGQLV
jgi:hypothetical protein